MLITHFPGEPQGCMGIKSALSKSSSCTFSSNEKRLENVTLCGFQHLFLLHSKLLKEEAPSKSQVWYQKTLPIFLSCLIATGCDCTRHASAKGINCSNWCKCNHKNHKTTGMETSSPGSHAFVSLGYYWHIVSMFHFTFCYSAWTLSKTGPLNIKAFSENYQLCCLA